MGTVNVFFDKKQSVFLEINGARLEFQLHNLLYSILKQVI